MLNNFFDISAKFEIFKKVGVGVGKVAAVMTAVSIAILGVSNYSFHDRKFMLVSFQGAISQFNVSTVYNLTSIKNGVFDIE